MFIDLTNDRAPGEIPEGDYTVVCEDAEVKTTKSGTGEYLQVKFRVEEIGDFMYHSFNLKNENKKAEQIGRGQLKQFLTASGFATPNQLEDILQLSGLRAKAHVKPKTDDYGVKPRITSFKAIS